MEEAHQEIEKDNSTQVRETPNEPLEIDLTQKDNEKNDHQNNDKNLELNQSQKIEETQNDPLEEENNNKNNAENEEKPNHENILAKSDENEIKEEQNIVNGQTRDPSEKHNNDNILQNIEKVISNESTGEIQSNETKDKEKVIEESGQDLPQIQIREGGKEGDKSEELIHLTDKKTEMESPKKSSNKAPTTQEFKSLVKPQKQIKKPATSKNKFDKYSSIDDRLAEGAPQKDFDEIPVGGAGDTFQISEYPEGMNPFPEDQGEAPQDIGPLATRVKSKVWKVRQTAFEELGNKFLEADPSDQIFDEYSSDLEKFIADSNPGAQEKALEVVKAYLQKKGGTGLDANSVTKILVDKALGPAKPNIKILSHETLCLIFEKMDKQGIFEGLIDSLNQKNQKTIIAGIQAIIELMKNYGPKKLDFLKPFFSHIEKVAGSTVSSLRSEFMNFYKEAYRFMGEALKPFITKLKKAQVDELEKFFAECPKELAQPLKAEEVKSVIKEDESEKGKVQRITDKFTTGNEGFDPYDIADPVDIFKKYNDKWCSKVLGLDKWNEKKAVLEEFLKEAEQTPKIANVPIQHITSMLKKLLNDNNFPIVFTTVKIYGALAKGLRRYFHAQCKAIMPFILEKLKDKRSALIEETTKTLDNFLYCLALDDIIEELKEGLHQKSPNMRITLLSWIDKYFEKHSNNTEKLVNLFKNLLPVLKKLVDDSSNEVREAVIKTLAKQKVILGADIIKDSFDDLNPNRLSKINNLVSGITGVPISESEETKTIDLSTASPSAKGKSKLGGSFAQTLEEEKSPKTIGSASKMSKPGQKVIHVKPGSSVTKKTESDGKKSALKEASKTQISKTTIENEIESFEVNMADEDVEFKLAELGLPEKINHSLNDSNWKEKQKGLTEFSQWISDNTNAVSDCMEYIYQFLKAKMKDWKESNPNVLKEALQLILNAGNNQSIIHNKKSLSVIIPFLLANIQESKYSQLCHSIIFSLIECISPRFVIISLISGSQETKTAKPNPKILIEVCNLLTKLANDLPLILFPLKETIEFGKVLLAGSLPASKTAAINLFKAIYHQTGPQLNDFLTDINPIMFKTFQAEFNKIQPNKEMESKIKFRGDAEKETKIELSKRLDPLESFPRVDISKDAEKIIKKLNDNDWKIKQEGLDALDSLLATTGNRIAANGLHNLTMILKQRLNDHNKNQVKNFIIFVGKFIYALGAEGKAHAKILLPEIVKNLSDKQTIIRAETAKTADKFGYAIGNETVINSLLPLLISESPELRIEVLNWILKNQESLPKADIKGNVGPVLAVLQDKTKDIRNLAEKLLEKCIEVITVEPYKNIIKDMKPAVQEVLKPVLNKIMGEEEIQSLADASFDKSKVIEQSKTIKNNPLETNVTTSKQAKPKPRLQNAASLKTEGDETKEYLKKPSLNQSGNIAMNLSRESLNNSVSSNTEASYLKSILSTGEKTKRQEEDKKTKWPTEEVRDDLVTKLRDHLKKYVSKDLFTKMFAPDSKKHVEAVRILNKALIVEFQETVEILDLILRWFFARLWDNVNTQMMKESLDYFFSLAMSLEAAKYTLLDFEANVLVPCLVNRLGTGPSNLKISLHKIFPKLGGICPPQKIAGFLVDAMKSRSHKTKIESIEVLAEMVKAYGPDIISQRDLKMYGKLLGDFDVNIKTNTLKLMIEVGQYMGEELLNLTGNDIPPKLQEIIQQKRLMNEESQNEDDEIADDNEVFNKIKIEIEPQFDEIQEVEEEQGMYASQYKPRKPKSEVLVDEEKIEYQSPPKIEKFDSLVEEEESQERIQTPIENPLDESMEGEEQIKNELSNVVLLGERVEEILFEKCIELLKKGSVAGKLDALLFIQDIITSENQENKDFLEANAGTLLGALQVVLSSLLSRPSSQVTIKFLMYFLDMIHKLVTIKSFLKGVPEESLESFFEALFQNLLEQNEKTQLDPKESSPVLKALNSIVLRLLENSDPNKNITALYNLIAKYQKNLEDDRIIGLSLKCILKLANVLRQLVSFLRPDRILLTLHKFLLLQEEINDELPIQSAKIILQNLVNMYGSRIQHQYSQGVEKDASKDQYLKNWINILLKAKADKDWTPATVGNYDDEEETVIKSGGSEEAQIRVKELLENLKKTVDFKIVIEQLYKELHNNQEVNIRPFLECEKDSFKLYVLSALEKLHFEKSVPSIRNSRVQINEKLPYEIKPVQTCEKENMLNHGLDESDFEHQRTLMNTLKIRYALITKNANVEFDQIVKEKTELIPPIDKEIESPEKKVTQRNKGENSSIEGKALRDLTSNEKEVTQPSLNQEKTSELSYTKNECPKLENKKTTQDESENINQEREVIKKFLEGDQDQENQKKEVEKNKKEAEKQKSNHANQKVGQESRTEEKNEEEEKRKGQENELRILEKEDQENHLIEIETNIDELAVKQDNFENNEAQHENPKDPFEHHGEEVKFDTKEEAPQENEPILVEDEEIKSVKDENLEEKKEEESDESVDIL